jgi:hypothetical protein
MPHVVPYPGEAVGKKIARIRLYRRVESLYQCGGFPSGWAIVLAGDKAHEAWVLRYLLNWNPSRVLFVDRDKRGIKEARKIWPEANVFHGDINDALKYCDSIGFAHLDFMGIPTLPVRRAIRRTGELLLPKGIVTYTFSRGRENKFHRNHLRDLYQRALDFERYNDIDIGGELDVYRFLGYQLLLEELIDRDPLHMVLALRYRRTIKGMAMGSLTFQYMPAHAQTLEWRREARDDKFSGYVDSRVCEREMRQHIEELREISPRLSAAIVL